ncbi:MAG: FliH/SctL family protein [Defluviitaleaceae bacterium]|nr:FliH/SctL family protein [Defluviitaleaceae bacterium]
MPRVLKAATVYVDQENKVQIKNAVIKPKLPEVIEEMLPEVSDVAPEEQAQDIVQQAHDDAAFILGQAEKEYEELITKGQKEVENLIVEAQSRMEEEGRRIREECKIEGYQEGIDSALEEATAIRTEAKTLLADTVKTCDQTRLDIEPDVVNLIINIVEKLLANAVNINPSVVVALIRAGFDSTTLSGQVVVRVSDNDYVSVMEYKEELTAVAKGAANVEIVRDVSLKSTECIIDTPYGGIDVSLTPQFESLRENLIYLLEH